MASSSWRCCSTPASGQSNVRICASAFRSESRAGRTLEIAMLSIVVNAGEKVIRFSRSRPEPVIQREPRSTGTR
jgi:hypothetical protein